MHCADSATLAFSLLDQINSSSVGKSGIVDGVEKWHSTNMTASGSGCASGESSQTSIAWATVQLREQSTSLAEICKESAKACMEAAGLVDSLIDFEKLVDGEGSPAANRFKSAVQAAVKFAASSEGNQKGYKGATLA